jgi:hypothetical protein
MMIEFAMKESWDGGAVNERRITCFIILPLAPMEDLAMHLMPLLGLAKSMMLEWKIQTCRLM